MNPIQLLVIQLIAIPALQPIIAILKKAAAKTETPIDDSIVGAFEVVHEALKDPAIMKILNEGEKK